MKQMRIRQKFLLVISAFCISVVTPVLIPFSIDKNGNLNTVGYVAGAMFWGGLLLGIAAYILLWRKAKEQIQEYAIGRKLPPGLRFFSNPPAMAADILLIMGAAGTAYCAVNITVNQIMAAIFLLLLLAGFYAHFLLNGNVYYYIWNCKNKKTSEKTKEGKE